MLAPPSIFNRMKIVPTFDRKRKQQQQINLPVRSGELVELVSQAVAAQRNADDQVRKLLEQQQSGQATLQFHNSRNPACSCHCDGQNAWRLADHGHDGTNAARAKGRGQRL